MLLGLLSPDLPKIRQPRVTDKKVSLSKYTTLMGVLWPFGSCITIVNSLDRDRALSESYSLSLDHHTIASGSKGSLQWLVGSLGSINRVFPTFLPKIKLYYPVSEHFICFVLTDQICLKTRPVQIASPRKTVDF